MECNLDKCYEVVLQSVKHVGEIIKQRIWNVKNKIETKSSEIDFVTETDQEVERYLISTLKKNFPNHLFIGEESVENGVKWNLTDGPTWIIDPVDGTMNFVHGYPNVCVSIALLVKKIPEIAIIYNPVLDYLFEARRNDGAKLNGKPIQVSGQEELSKSLLAFEFGTSREEDKLEINLSNVKNLCGKVHGLRSSGSAALNMAFVAVGFCDAYFEFGTHAWDVAAGELIVKEAGGIVIDPAGGDFKLMSRRVLCAASQTLADKIAQEIHQFYPESD